MQGLKKALAIAIGAIVIGTSLAAHATEKEISFLVNGQKVNGTLDLPDGVKTPPVVLMLHGFTGARNEWASEHLKEGLFGHCAQVLDSKGIASLRIDFRGSGSSDGKFEDMTIESEIKDAMAALDFLSKQENVNGRKISVVGMSLGGIVATAAAGRTSHPLRSVVLWNPGINPPAAFISIYGEQIIKDGLTTGNKPLSATMRGGGKTVLLKQGFFDSLYRVVPAAEIVRYKGPLLLAVGTKDTLVFPQPVQAETLLSYHHGPHVLWTQPVDHGFDVEKKADSVNALALRTADYIVENSK